MAQSVRGILGCSGGVSWGIAAAQAKQTRAKNSYAYEKIKFLIVSQGRKAGEEEGVKGNQGGSMRARRHFGASRGNATTIFYCISLLLRLCPATATYKDVSLYTHCYRSCCCCCCYWMSQIRVEQDETRGGCQEGLYKGRGRGKNSLCNVSSCLKSLLGTGWG